MNRRKFLKWLGVGLLATFAASGGGVVMARRSGRYYSGAVSNHYNGQHFFNPGGRSPRNFSDLLKWQFGGNRQKWPEKYPSPFHGSKPPSRVNKDQIRITMIGHASLLLQVNGLNFLTDPIWSERASPVQFAGPKRVNPPGVDFVDLPPIDYVLLTHNHYDHMDLATLKVLVSRDNPLIITPLGNDTILKRKMGAVRVQVGDWGDIFEIDPDVRVHFEPSHHWSARGMFDRRRALWAAFVIETEIGNIYHIGDTGFHDAINYRAAAKKHGGFKVALLPIGAYEPRWFMEAQHQNPDEAVRGHLACNAEVSVAHHWGTFQLTDEAIEQPVRDLEQALEKHQVSADEFRILRPGESWDA